MHVRTRYADRSDLVSAPRRAKGTTAADTHYDSARSVFNSHRRRPTASRPAGRRIPVFQALPSLSPSSGSSSFPMPVRPLLHHDRNHQSASQYSTFKQICLKD